MKIGIGLGHCSPTRFQPQGDTKAVFVCGAFIDHLFLNILMF